MSKQAKVIAILLVLVLCAVAQADELLVPAEYPTIQDAINDCNDGDTVIIDPNTYTGPGNRDIDFLGKAITVRSESGPENCIIDCNSTEAESHRGFIFWSGEDSNSVLEGFTITNGFGPGGGIYCSDSSPTITNCIITGNTSTGDGGGIYCDQVGLSITNCTISGNNADNKGGGIYCSTGIIIKNSVITGNWSDKGGGIYSHDGINIIENCTFSGNRAVNAGGGFYCFFPPASYIPPFYDQPPEYDGQPWGPLPPLPLPDLPPSSSKIINSIFRGNISDQGPQVAAASAYAPSPPPWPPSPPEWPYWLDRFKLYPDSVSDEQTELILTDWPSRPWPSPPDWPWPVPPWWPPEWPWPPTPPSPPSPPWPPSPPPQPPHPRVISIKYSDIQDSQDGVYTDSGWWLNWGSGNTDADPCFVEPGYWDVNDPNIIVEPNDTNAVWIDGDYHLLLDSLCIDAGDPNYLPEPDETDIDGNPRIIGGRVDMGAYEFNHLPVACVVGGDRTVEAEADCRARVTLDGSCSSDVDSTPGTNDINDFDWYEVIDPCDPNSDIFLGSGEIIECNLPLGEHTIILEVTDKAGAFDSNEATITVEDRTPPEITLNGLATMTLECGVDSYTEEGATAIDNCDPDVVVVIGGDTVDTSTCGTYVVTYDATDDSGNSAVQVTRTVIVEDTIPPEFSLWVEPNVLWPPNHTMVLITPSWEVSDNCDEWPEVTLVDITSSEEDNAKGGGDGNTTGDILVDPNDGSIYLRAERDGSGSGRIYTLTYEAVDDSNNVTVDSATVTVPHDQRRHRHRYRERTGERNTRSVSQPGLSRWALNPNP